MSLSNQKNSLIAISIVSALAVIACYVLLYLSQYAEMSAPPQQLQSEVIFFLGLLFTGLIFPFTSKLERSSAYLFSAIGLAVAAIVAFLLTSFTIPSPTNQVALQASFLYLLAPFVALVTANLMQQFFPDKASLWVAMLVYVVCTILANYTLDAFIPVPINTPDWLPFSIEGKINVGTLFFGIIFTQRDRIHIYGKRYAYLTIAIAAIANVGAAWRLFTPLRFIVVSFFALVLSELTDTEIYQRFIDRSWLTRVATSNAFSVPVDSIIFTVFAFWGADFATPQWMTEVILTDIIVKFLIGLVVAIQVFRMTKNKPTNTLNASL